jgi:hypothetical protein
VWLGPLSPGVTQISLSLDPSVCMAGPCLLPWSLARKLLASISPILLGSVGLLMGVPLPRSLAQQPPYCRSCPWKRSWTSW